MLYTNIQPGVFLDRPNRFVAHVEINGHIELCHVKNTGRCRELLVPGTRVYLERSDKPERRTKYDLIAVEKGTRLINMDSQAPNHVFGEYLQTGRYIPSPDLIRPETRYGSSRFDFYAESENKRIFLEVKGVTLEIGGHAFFPDAPTERGVKHLHELIAALKDGYEAHAVFVIQMKDVHCFSPNRQTHPAFADALIAASAAGVKLCALNCSVTPDSLHILGRIPIEL